MDDKQKKLSEVLRSKRYENNLTQEKAAELLALSARHYRELESGRSLPAFKTICKLAKTYEIDFAQFVEDEEDII